MSGDQGFFQFPRWAEALLGGRPAPDPKGPDLVNVESKPEVPVKRGRGRPPGAKNKAKRDIGQEIKPCP